ncbi:MAG: beta-N-acetylhexosaminidase [Rickettsiales bacterium]|nr:beta-N-acetylhexosaminidase [Rickettsiales bacterium]
MPRKPVIYGLSGFELTSEERSFFAAESPAGYILFARNCQDPKQLRTLTNSLKALHPDYLPLILIDQEGGRVARLKPPHWRHVPPAASFARVADTDMMAARQLVYLNARLIAEDLVACGINTDCAPLADIPSETCHDIIGDRAYGTTPSQVVTLGRAMAEGLLDGGVLPVLKHIPGHGRAEVDSHESLPVVNASLDDLLAQDFVPFMELADLPLGMTAHIRYTAIDQDLPATLSEKTIHMVRDKIGFKGLLMTDDLSMKALQGDLGRLAQDSLLAGCDLVLHCNGVMSEMQHIGSALTVGDDRLQKRLDAAIALISPLPSEDASALLAEYQTLCTLHGVAA